MPADGNTRFGLLAAHTVKTAASTVTELKITPTKWLIGYGYVRASFTKTNLCQA